MTKPQINQLQAELNARELTNADIANIHAKGLILVHRPDLYTPEINNLLARQAQRRANRFLSAAGV